MVQRSLSGGALMPESAQDAVALLFDDAQRFGLGDEGGNDHLEAHGGTIGIGPQPHRRAGDENNRGEPVPGNRLQPSPASFSF